MIAKPGQIIRRSNGQAIVEMAIVLPILLMVVLGTSEFGNAWKQKNTVTSAAREAARVAAVNPQGSGIPASVARNMLISSGIRSTPTISVSAVNPATNQITVTVSVQYQPILGLYILKRAITLTGSTTMRWEG